MTFPRGNTPASTQPTPPNPEQGHGNGQGERSSSFKDAVSLFVSSSTK